MRSTICTIRVYISCSRCSHIRVTTTGYYMHYKSTLYYFNKIIMPKEIWYLNPPVHMPKFASDDSIGLSRG
jgi:hypothetical protein